MKAGAKVVEVIATTTTATMNTMMTRNRDKQRERKDIFLSYLLNFERSSILSSLFLSFSLTCSFPFSFSFSHSLVGWRNVAQMESLFCSLARSVCRSLAQLLRPTSTSIQASTIFIFSPPLLGLLTLQRCLLPLLSLAQFTCPMSRRLTVDLLHRLEGFLVQKCGRRTMSVWQVENRRWAQASK